INLNDLNEKPILAADTFLIDENSINGLSVGFAIAQDQDTLTPFSYNIIAGAYSVFAIKTATGDISVIDSTYLDVETIPTFEITVELPDPRSSLFPYTTLFRSINLNDLNEKPILAADTFLIDENSINGLSVGFVIAQ